MKYFDDITTFGLEATCSSCGVLTFFTGRNRYRMLENGIHLVKYDYQFQCQDCGELKMPGVSHGYSQTLAERCNCGGQYRRDKPLFCKSCKTNKTHLNTSDALQ